jgi:antitoxin ParD1/3/4
MTHITITLPDRAQAYIAAQIASGRHTTADEVLTALIEQAQDRDDDTILNGPEHLQIQTRSQLNAQLTEGLESGEAIAVTDKWWEEKRQRLFERTGNRA